MLDQGVHVDGWSREQAMHLMTARRVPAGARGRRQVGARAAVVGAAADLLRRRAGAFDLRKPMAKKRGGDKFDLKAYHDKVLSYGSPPVRYVRELMLDEPIR